MHLDMLQEDNDNDLEKLRFAEESCQDAEMRVKELEKQVAALGEGIYLEEKLLSRNTKEVKTRDNKLKDAIEAALLKKLGLVRKSRVSNLSDESSAEVLTDCQGQLSRSSIVDHSKQSNGEVFRLIEGVKQLNFGMGYKLICQPVHRLREKHDEFHYLDRYFITRRYLPALNEVGLTCFRESVSKGKAKDDVFALIVQECEGEQIDRALLKNVLGIYVEIGMGQMDFYEKDFETDMLVDSAATKRLQGMGVSFFFRDLRDNLGGLVQVAASHLDTVLDKLKDILDNIGKSVLQRFLSFFSDKTKIKDSDDIHVALALMYGYAARYAPSTVIEARRWKKSCRATVSYLETNRSHCFYTIQLFHEMDCFVV
ncbi:unnamed protein product [Lactuca virosa]|uniref:Cullin N-terminal domain-containing protein n=1 Tax=Lactuca virosa TaxID=75947 RepID=A0AAU9NDF2_9ASTR|nr:unnamed protein product [Lactuca virosa]